MSHFQYVHPLEGYFAQQLNDEWYGSKFTSTESRVRRETFLGGISSSTQLAAVVFPFESGDTGGALSLLSLLDQHQDQAVEW